MKTTLSALLLTGLAISFPTMTFGETADAKLDGFYRQHLEKVFEMRPVEATELGDHRFDDRLDDLSAAARDAWVQLDRQTLAELPRQVEYDELSSANKVNYEILKHALTRAIWTAENLRPFEEDPRTYNGYINDSVYILLTQSTLPKEKNVANAIARMGSIPQIIAAAKEEPP